MKKSILAVLALVVMFSALSTTAFAQGRPGFRVGVGVGVGVGVRGNYGYYGGRRGYAYEAYGPGFGFNLGWYNNGFVPQQQYYTGQEWDPNCDNGDGTYGCYVDYTANWDSYYGGYSYWIGDQFFVRPGFFWGGPRYGFYGAYRDGFYGSYRGYNRAPVYRGYNNGYNNGYNRGPAYGNRGPAYGNRGPAYGGRGPAYGGRGPVGGGNGGQRGFQGGGGRSFGGGGGQRGGGGHGGGHR